MAMTPAQQKAMAEEAMASRQMEELARPRSGEPGPFMPVMGDIPKISPKEAKANRDDLNAKIKANQPAAKPEPAPAPRVPAVRKFDIQPAKRAPVLMEPVEVAKAKKAKAQADMMAKKPTGPSPGNPSMGTPTNAGTRPAPMAPMPLKPDTAPMPEKPYPVTGNNGNLASKLPTGMMTPQPTVQPGTVPPANAIPMAPSNPGGPSSGLGRTAQLGSQNIPLMKRGGKVRNKPAAKFSSGGSTSKASSRGDGIAQRGKTKGRYI